MNKNLGKLITKEAKRCPSCSEADACLARPVMLYINEIGFQQFYWQLINDKLPIYIKVRLDSLSSSDFINNLQNPSN